MGRERPNAPSKKSGSSPEAQYTSLPTVRAATGRTNDSAAAPAEDHQSMLLRYDSIAALTSNAPPRTSPTISESPRSPTRRHAEPPHAVRPRSRAEFRPTGLGIARPRSVPESRFSDSRYRF